MPSKNELCPQCGAILKTPVCMKCGYDSAAIDEVLAADTDLDENESAAVKPIPEKIETREQVRSIFTDIAVASGTEAKIPEKVKQKKYVMPAVLSVMVVGILAAAYWRFIYFTPDYVSPMVLSASEIQASDGDVDVSQADDEKTIDLQSGLEAGNFEAGNFAQFGSTDTKVMVQAFNLKNIFEKFRKESALKEIQDAYKISDDDLEVYFTKGFAYFVPGDNIDTWGFVIGVNDKEYVEKRLADFAKNKENPKYKYVNYSVELVETTGTGEIMEGTPSAEEDQDKDKANDSDKDKDEDSGEEATDDNNQMYLLISNSNEYLDQMKEASEGNLTNLANEAVYAQSKADLPKVGEILVYREGNASVWNMLADIVAEKYDYVGLDKVLKAMEATGSVFYSVDSKVKVAMSEEDK